MTDPPTQTQPTTSKLPSRIGTALAIVLIGVILWLNGSRAWHYPARAAIQRMGGSVTYLTAAELRGRVAIILPGTVSDDELEKMTELDRLEPVWLQLPKAPVTNRGVASLKRLKELRGLSLLGTRVDDDGMQHLLELKNLHTLNLDGCAVTDRALAVLGQIPQLRGLSVIGTKVTPDGVNKLRKARPDLDLHSRYDPDDD
jgi:hypothetical protein